MNREIKFRGWNTRTKNMMDLKKLTPLAVSEGVCDGLFLPFYEDIALMQFTGLHDKNGVEIYEGDLLSQHGNKGKTPQPIRFFDGAFFVGDRRLYGTIANFGEVVGNIYEHPNLLNHD